ncbi:MAG TPA: sigma-70 family RNA polymerase sigma factor [Dehalococcoidia bacterium]|nr:sigma-70 family RNA polymerase sigma factor [Dehalococcoidia bacterium]
MGVSEALSIPGEQYEEALLIARAQQADRSAWDEIFNRYYHRVYVFVFARVGDATAAEDLAADVFVEAWRGIRRFTYRGVPLLSWLYRIAHNLLADFLTKRNRTKTQPLGEGPREAADPQDDAERVVLWQTVAGALRRLTREQQVVLVSRFVEGMSLAETAALMGKNENAVKQLEFRALRSVRKTLGVEGTWG